MLTILPNHFARTGPPWRSVLARVVAGLRAQSVPQSQAIQTWPLSTPLSSSRTERCSCRHHLMLRLLQRRPRGADLAMQPQLLPVLDRRLRPALEPQVVGRRGMAAEPERDQVIEFVILWGAGQAVSEPRAPNSEAPDARLRSE